jgi:hypothetical protein
MFFIVLIIAVLLFVIVWANPSTREVLLEGGGCLFRAALWLFVIGLIAVVVIGLIIITR